MAYKYSPYADLLRRNANYFFKQFVLNILYFRNYIYDLTFVNVRKTWKRRRGPLGTESRVVWDSPHLAIPIAEPAHLNHNYLRMGSGGTPGTQW